MIIYLLAVVLCGGDGDVVKMLNKLRFVTKRECSILPAVIAILSHNFMGLRPSMPSNH